MSVQVNVVGPQVIEQWPRIHRGLRINEAGDIDDDIIGWERRTSSRLSAADLAAAYEQWADFYEWLLEHRAAHLAPGSSQYRVVARWTDSMAYSCRRSASWARGVHPGKVCHQSERRPDLYEPTLCAPPMRDVSMDVSRPGPRLAAVAP